MDFFILKDSTLPTLKMKLITDSDLDYNKFNEMIETSVITFSMVDVNNKTFKIANKSANIIVKEYEDLSKGIEYYLEYRWSGKDTSKTGSYLGEFKIDFVENGSICNTIKVPIKEKLFIHINDSITKTEINC